MKLKKYFYFLNYQDLEITKQFEQKSTIEDPEFKQRSKKLFGSILSHLGSAKKILDKDSQKVFYFL